MSEKLLDWTYEPAALRWTAGAYVIAPAAIPLAGGRIGWVITRDGRPASALIFKRPADAMSLAEWDARAYAQANERANARVLNDRP